MKKTVLFLTAIAIFWFFNYSLYKKEEILAHGEKIYLELRPVDPRSFMQGDYMALRFKIEEEARKDKNEILPYKGKIIVALDEKKVGHFVNIYNGEDLYQTKFCLIIGRVVLILILFLIPLCFRKVMRLYMKKHIMVFLNLKTRIIC
jgi:hypothetical protein